MLQKQYVQLLDLNRYGDVTYNTDNRQNVASYWNGVTEEKELVAYATFCFLWRYVRQKIDRMWRYTFKLRKRRNLFARLQTKVQKPAWILVPSPFTISLKWQNREICPLLIVDTYYFLLYSLFQKKWNTGILTNWLLSNWNRLLNWKEPVT